MRLPRWLTVALVNALLLLVVVVVLELVFGYWVRADRLSRLNIVRGQRQFDVSGLYDTDAPLITYTRDEYGLRGEYSSLDAIDVLTIGGSTTDQRDLADGKTWQDVLVREFAATGKSVSVVNAGVDGQSSFGHLKSFDWWFPRLPGLRARYYLFYIGINDFFREEGHWFDALDTGEPQSLRDHIREKSALYHLARTIKGTLRARVTYRLSHRSIDFSQHEWTHDGLLDDYEAIMRDRLAAYRSRLLALCERVHDAGGVPIFVTQPSRRYKKTPDGVLGSTERFPYGGAEANGVDYYHLIRLLDAVTMQVCAERGGVCIDMAGDTQWDDDDFYDFVHNTPKGAEKVGRYLYARLAPLFEKNP